MSNSLTHDDLTLFLADQDPLCVSLYQPTYWRHPENQPDPIRYQNLLKVLGE